MADPGQDFIQGYFGQLAHAQQKQQQSQQAQEFAQTLALHQHTQALQEANQQSEDWYRKAQVAHQAGVADREARNDQFSHQLSLAGLMQGGATVVPPAGQGTPVPGALGVNQESLDPHNANFGSMGQLHIPTLDEKNEANLAIVKKNYHESLDQGLTSLDELKKAHPGAISPETEMKIRTMLTFDPSSTKASDIEKAFNPDKEGKMPTTDEMFAQTLAPFHAEMSDVLKKLGPVKALSDPTFIKASRTINDAVMKRAQAGAMVAPAAKQAEEANYSRDNAEMTAELQKELKGVDIKKATSRDLIAPTQRAKLAVMERRAKEGKPVHAKALDDAINEVMKKMPEREGKPSLASLLEDKPK